MGIANQKGFSLIEVLTALFITSIVGISVYSLFISFHKNFSRMLLISEMHHNTDSALNAIIEPLKSAGNDPLGIIFSDSYPAIRKALNNYIHFEMDIKGDAGNNQPDGIISGTKESIIFSLYDSGGDGDLDLGRKKEGGRNTPVAENIEKIEFFYFDRDLGRIIEPVDLSEIKSVMVAVLGRSAKKINDYRNNSDYSLKLPDGTIEKVFSAKNDSYNRYLVSAFVYLNNLE